MTNEEILQAAQALTQATESEAVRLGEDVENRQGQLAEGLQTGSNAPGGYNYARNIAPVVNPLTTSITAAAQQGVLRQALRDNQFAAAKALEDAQFGYRERQRAYQAEQARRNRERRLRAEREAAIAAQNARNRNIATSGGGGVVRSTPSRQLRVASAPQTQRITSVGNARPRATISVGNARPTQTIRIQ